MNKPNFQAMSQKELHDYFLAHRDDELKGRQGGLKALTDKVHNRVK